MKKQTIQKLVNYISFKLSEMCKKSCYSQKYDFKYASMIDGDIRFIIYSKLLASNIAYKLSMTDNSYDFKDVLIGYGKTKDEIYDSIYERISRYIRLFEDEYLYIIFNDNTQDYPYILIKHELCGVSSMEELDIKLTLMGY